MTTLSIIKFIFGAIPTILKISQYVAAAAKEMEGKPGKEKLAWVMEQLRIELPKLDSDSLYNWVNNVVYMMRNMGKQT